MVGTAGMSVTRRTALFSRTRGPKTTAVRPNLIQRLLLFQGVFEGMKAYRTEKGRVVVFRPDEVRSHLSN